jgi:AAHS family 4-hydroxybenzoate transporter-like MFS transporter
MREHRTAEPPAPEGKRMPEQPTINITRLVDEQRIHLFGLGIIFLSFLVMFSDGYALAAAAYAAPMIVRQWHLNRAVMGPVFSASLFGMLFGAPILGYMGDRFGRKGAIILGCLLYGFSSLAIVESHTLHQLIALRFISGIGLGGLPPNTIALNAEFAPKRARATMIVFMFMGITVGGIFPGAVTAYLPKYGWQGLFFIGGAFPIVVALASFFFLPESIKFLVLRDAHEKIANLARKLSPGISIPPGTKFLIDEKHRTGFSIRLIFADGRVWMTPLLWLLFFCNLMANFFLNSWMPTLFQDAGLSVRQTALTMAMFYFGGIAGGITISRLLDKRGLAAIGFSFLLACPIVAAIGTPGLSHNLLSVAVFFAGFCILGNQLGLNAVSGLLYPTAIRSNGVGWAISGPMIGGWLIARHLPLQRLFLAPVAPLLVGAVASFVLMRVCFKLFGGRHLESEARPLNWTIAPEPESK